MAYYYFPSCKATAQFKEASKKARAYVKEQFGINPIECCTVDVVSVEDMA